jgi:hypothetical protein
VLAPVVLVDDDGPGLARLVVLLHGVEDASHPGGVVDFVELQPALSREDRLVRLTLLLRVVEISLLLPEIEFVEPRRAGLAVFVELELALGEAVFEVFAIHLPANERASGRSFDE